MAFLVKTVFLLKYTHLNVRIESVHTVLGKVRSHFKVQLIHSRSVLIENASRRYQIRTAALGVCAPTAHQLPGIIVGGSCAVQSYCNAGGCFAA